MDILALSTDYQTNTLMGDINIALMSKAKEQMEVNADNLQKMLEASVTPNLGKNFDVYL